MQAFVYLGGVTPTVLVDNQKTAVLDWATGSPRFNRRFRELGKHCGFVPKACRPRRAQTKGKVERMVFYVKENALGDQRVFDSLEALNNHLRHWCESVANVRIHSELKESVKARWERERPQLQALPRQSLIRLITSNVKRVWMLTWPIKVAATVCQGILPVNPCHCVLPWMGS